MRKLKERGYMDMHPFFLDLESQYHGPLSHRSAGNRLGVSRKFDETDNLAKHAEVCDDTIDPVLPELVAFLQEDETGNLAKHAEVCDDTIDPLLPELVAFLQETSASGERHPSHGRCDVRGCEVDHNAISCILDSDADGGSNVARHALWTETSTSYVLKFKAKQVLHKDRAEIRSPEQVATEKKADVPAKDEIPVEHISPEMLPTHGHIPGETSAMPNSSASYIAAGNERDVHPDINQRQECPGSSEFSNAFEVESKLMLGSLMSETGTKSGQILVTKQVCGDAYFSAASPIATPPRESDTVPYLRTISLRSKSNSSTTSSKSFSFPLLPFEWNGSPLEMAKADRTRLQEQQNRPWWTHLVCCKQKYISRCDSDDEIAHKIAK